MGELTFFSNYLNNVAETPNKQWRSEQQAFIDNSYEIIDYIYQLFLSSFYLF